jgi:hypothetical protein
VPTEKCRVVLRELVLTDLFADRGVLTSAHQEEEVDASKCGKTGRLQSEMHCHTAYMACREAMIDDATLLRMRR